MQMASLPVQIEDVYQFGGSVMAIMTVGMIQMKMAAVSDENWHIV